MIIEAHLNLKTEVAFVTKSNNCCAAMWHTTNGMMKTLTLTLILILTPVKWDHVTRGASSYQNTSCTGNYIMLLI